MVDILPPPRLESFKAGPDELTWAERQRILTEPTIVADSRFSFSRGTERWRVIPGFPEYFISDEGRVASIRCGPEGVLLKGSRNRPGHSSSVTLQRPKSAYDTRPAKTYVIAWLVCRAFGDPPPEGFTCMDCKAAHIDHDRDNNFVENLVWHVKDVEVDEWVVTPR